jgi:glycosyltransferase involved in cell wall biosynthesis
MGRKTPMERNCERVCGVDMMKKLVIISHTEHQQAADGSFVGWGPTVNEINYLSIHWEEVIHVACLEKGKAVKGSSVGYSNKNVHFEAIPPFGGKRIWQKVNIIWKMPFILWKVQKSIKGASHVQLRVPMGIGLFLIPFFALRNQSKYIFWVKYANNWGSSHVPFGYCIQRWFLMKNILNSKVTINGFWPNQPKKCISFENPCLTENQISEGNQRIQSKKFDKPYHLVFVGRIDAAKGVDILIDFILKIDKTVIEFFHIIGEGKLSGEFEKVLDEFGIPNKFYGNLTQVGLFEILKKSHCIMLPSKSEGFPKVLAEAMNYGCIPIASNVGSISHYIKDGESGIIMNEISTKGLTEAWLHFLNLNSEVKLRMAQNGSGVSQNFTFESYLYNLKSKIF